MRHWEVFTRKWRKPARSRSPSDVELFIVTERDNARRTFVSIAKQLNMNVQTVHLKYHRTKRRVSIGVEGKEKAT